MKLKLAILAVFPVLLAMPSSAQIYFERNYSVPVFRQGEALPLAWEGGLNTVQVSALDANLDGIDDLFLYDRSSRKPHILLRDEDGNFNYGHGYLDALPPIRSWALMADYNCDGHADLFTYSLQQGGVDIYRNTAPETGELGFELEVSLLQSLYNFNGTGFNTNIFISSEDIPALADYDGDGDLDLYTFTLQGTTLELHVNQSQELYGHCDSLTFELGARCYGQFAEGLEDNSIALGAECNLEVVDPRSTRDNRHIGSTICALDLDENGKLDLVFGDVGAENLVSVYLDESSTNGRDTAVTTFTNFPADVNETNPVEMDLFPAAFYVDVNMDGVRDLVVSPNNGSVGINQRSVWLYLNTGQDDHPNFEYTTGSFMQEQMIDAGDHSIPVFQDVDGDGLTDLLITSGEVYTGTNATSRVQYYRNTGTSSSPVFSNITDNWNNLSALNVGKAIRLDFGDLNGDGATDMIIGAQDGRHYIFYNQSEPGEEMSFDLTLPTPITDNSGNPLDVGQYATPTLIDLDRDGLLDLVSGNINGYFVYYRNAGTSAAPIWQLITEELGGIHYFDTFPLSNGYTQGEFLELEGEYHFLVAGAAGIPRLYNNIDNNLEGEFTLLSTVLDTISDGIRSGVALADLNADGYVEMLVGNEAGGLTYFGGGDPVLTVSERESLITRLRVFPNPGSTEINIELPANNRYTINIFNNLGQLVYQTSRIGTGTQTLSLPELPAGMYHITAQSAHARYTARWLRK